MNESCRHREVSCLNEYELIRKYRCDNCGLVMMCSCDEPIGRRFERINSPAALNLIRNVGYR